MSPPFTDQQTWSCTPCNQTFVSADREPLTVASRVQPLGVEGKRSLGGATDLKTIIPNHATTRTLSPALTPANSRLRRTQLLNDNGWFEANPGSGISGKLHDGIVDDSAPVESSQMLRLLSLLKTFVNGFSIFVWRSLFVPFFCLGPFQLTLVDK